MQAEGAAVLIILNEPSLNGALRDPVYVSEDAGECLQLRKGLVHKPVHLLSCVWFGRGKHNASSWHVMQPTGADGCHGMRNLTKNTEAVL